MPCILCNEIPKFILNCQKILTNEISIVEHFYCSFNFELQSPKENEFPDTLGGFELIVPSGEGKKAMDADVIRYSAQTEKGILTVQIAKQECINDMSGQKSAYGTTIDTKYQTDMDYTRYKGCGRYLSDYRLHDIWVLDSINNNKILAADFTKGIPQLEFNLTDNKIMGHTGCNNLNGSIEVKGKKIQIGMLVTTRMACKNMDFESAYLRALTNKIIAYEIRPGKLYLNTGADSIFVYRKVD